MVDGNLVEMGKLIGAGLACTGMGGAAIGVGHVVGNFLSGALRNPINVTEMKTESARNPVTAI